MRAPIVIAEHESIKELGDLAKYKDKISKAFGDALKTEKDKVKKHLGVDANLTASYFIGASWLNIDEIEEPIPFQVIPKNIDRTNDVNQTDYVKMFATALEVDSSDEAEYFSDYYHIDFDSPKIEVDAESNLMTPLLLLHYLSILTQLTKRGLRKGYVQREENLQSKVRGRILFTQNLRKNILNKREDRVYCKFQEYTVDTPENRFLKKALLFTETALQNIPSLQGDLADDIFQRIGTLETSFALVSEDSSSAKTFTSSSSKLYSHYSEAIKVAEMVLQFCDYDMDKSGKNKYHVRPFCIDMSRLYEMYVFHLLNTAYPGQIKFQVKGRHGTQVDFIKVSNYEKIILDAKYKPKYAKGNSGIVDDVREISGYARDKKILKELGWYNENGLSVDGKLGKLFPDCVIIYPVVQVEENDDEDSPNSVVEKDCACQNDFMENTSIIHQCDEIKAFEGFYKIAIPLPVKRNNTK